MFTYVQVVLVAGHWWTATNRAPVHPSTVLSVTSLLFCLHLSDLMHDVSVQIVYSATAGIAIRELTRRTICSTLELRIC